VTSRCATVACCATLDAVLANDTPPDLVDHPLSGMRLAVPKTFVLEDMDSHVAAHFERSLSRLSAAGARIERIDVPEFAGIPAINAHLQSKGWRIEREHLLIKDFPVQFLAASGLTEEAVRNAKRIEYEGVPAKVFRPEYIIAIAASVGRHKDFARIEQMLDQVKIDKLLLDDILRRYNLKLPNK